MPLPPKVTQRRRDGKLVPITRLDLPVIGMESEFNVWVDGIEIIPETYWKTPQDFIEVKMLAREKSSSQLPTGGAVYFDRGVIEVVTPVIEIAPSCTARVVRNLWEQIGFVRNALSRWEAKTGHHVRLKAYSCHYNVSFELRRRQQNNSKNIKKLALLLAYILPVPVIVLGANKRSTGVGVRPRGDRIEITVDFTPDPGLTIATATLIVGIVREVIQWDSYELSEISRRGIPIIADVIPGKHTTRKGWLTKDFHYRQSPYTTDIDARVWRTPEGRLMSLRTMARLTAWKFRKSLRRHSDPFSTRLLFAILQGRAPSLLDLADRPAAYEDVGILCKWGEVIEELRNFHSESTYERKQDHEAVDSALAGYHEEQATVARASGNRAHATAASPVFSKKDPGHGELAEAMATAFPDVVPLSVSASGTRAGAGGVASPRRGGSNGKESLLLPADGGEYIDRRRVPKTAPKSDRRAKERRSKDYTVPFPDRRLKRSVYEQVFLKLVSGGSLKIGSQVYTPVGMKGWYHAIFRRVSDGKERLLTIDQLLKKMDDWQV
ncbi:MAG TPA: hypothetical protein VNM92_04510 [Thermoanaerobaculia bacterium]|nr:hypothetical protein [Thermoanaerobaculia bacterium]